MFNIVVISPNSFFTNALRHNLGSPEFTISECLETLAGVSGSLKLAESRCDLVIVDFEACTGDVAGEMSRIKRARPELTMLSVLQTYDVQKTAACYQAGCDGVLLSNIKLESLTQHLTLLMSGHKVFPNQIADLMCDIGGHRGHNQLPHQGDLQFSPRQAKILHMVIDGAQNKCIARQLQMPLTTVKADIKAMMRKTGALNRTDLAIGVVRMSWAAQISRAPALVG